MTDILPKENCLIVNGCHRIETDAAVFAVGHTARDTFQMLFDRNVAMKSKSFAIGVRAEHRQDMIDLRCIHADHKRLLFIKFSVPCRL